MVSHVHWHMAKTLRPRRAAEEPVKVYQLLELKHRGPEQPGLQLCLCFFDIALVFIYKRW
jgi:hypothetical protein